MHIVSIQLLSLPLHNSLVALTGRCFICRVGRKTTLKSNQDSMLAKPVQCYVSWPGLNVLFSLSYTQFNSTCSCACKSMGLVSVYHMVQGLQEVDRSGPPWSLATYIPVGERCDHQSRGVPEVLIGVQELCITDVSKAVLLHLIPPVMMKDERYCTMTAWKDTSGMPLRLD